MQCQKQTPLANCGMQAQAVHGMHGCNSNWADCLACLCVFLYRARARILIVNAKSCAERTDGDRVAEPVDSVVSSPGAYGALSAIYAALAVPAALFPHSVCVSVLMHLPGILHHHIIVTLEALGHELGRQT